MDRLLNIRITILHPKRSPRHTHPSKSLNLAGIQAPRIQLHRLLRIRTKFEMPTNHRPEPINLIRTKKVWRPSPEMQLHHSRSG